MRVRLAGRRRPGRSTSVRREGPAWRFGAWFLLGALVYALYGYRRSALARRDEDTADRSR